MNKKILLVSLTSISTLAITFGILATAHNSSVNPLTAGKIQPGTIVIDVDDESINVNYGYNTYNTIKSEAGNDFSFCFRGFVKEDNLFKMQPYAELQNNTIINGITELRFVTPSYDQEIRINYSLNDYSEKDSTVYNVAGGGSNYLFGEYNPGYFNLQNWSDNVFSFSRLTICYECVADVPDVEMSYLSLQGELFGYQVENCQNCVFATIGTNLSDIELDGYAFGVKGSGKGAGHYINQEYLSNLSIEYNESESDLVLEGTLDATVSFNYQGTHYYRSNISVIGYDHIGSSANHVSGSSEYLRSVDDNTIPEGFTLHVYGSVQFLNNSEEVIDYFDGVKHIPLTLDLIVSSDENRFTGVGDHNMTINYEGKNYHINYSIYDPEYNNIRSIYFMESLEILVGSTLSDFYALIATKQAYIDYYVYDKDLPHEIYLTSDNVILEEGMFDTANSYVNVPVHYLNYKGTIGVNVVIEKGNLVKTYTNTDGVSCYAGTIYTINLYDNNTCELNPESYSNVKSCEKDGNVLIVHYYSSIIKFTVDDDLNTFTKYTRTEGIVKTLQVDFSSIGGGSNPYVGYIFDDMTVGFEIEDNLADTPYTVDSEDSNIIYFTRYEEDYMGTIDPETNIMVVKYAPHTPEKEGLIKKLVVDFSALGAPVLYDGYMYDDGTIILDVDGLIESSYTTDSENENIIYFNFTLIHQDCIGTIDPETNIMVVSLPEPEKEGLLKALSVDFSALGAPVLFDGYMYDDGTIIFEVGMEVECTYTVNPENENIIYFNFTLFHQDCIGTIDPETNIMVVAPVPVSE